MKITINNFDIYRFDNLEDTDLIEVEREFNPESQELECLIVSIAKDLQVIPLDLEVNVDNPVAWDWLCSIYESIGYSGEKITKGYLLEIIESTRGYFKTERKESWCLTVLKSWFNS